MNWLKLQMQYKMLKIKRVAGLVLISLATWFLSACNTKITKTKQILFIGNSYTYRNNMPLLFQEIARSKGENVEVSYITRGKYTFYLHSKRKLIRQALRRNRWDVIVLQGSSLDMLRDSVRLKKRTFPAIKKLVKLIEKRQKQSKVYFYMTWPYQKGDPDSMLLAVDNGYKILKQKYQIPVIPIGKIWRAYTLKYPSSNLYTKDNAHPSFVGSYLVACTMYQSIFNKSARGAPYMSLNSNAETKQIQEFVTEAFQSKQIKNYLK